MVSEETTEIILLTLRIAAVALAIGLPPAVFVGYVLARWAFPGKTLLSALVNVPLVLPPVATGYALLLAFGRTGPIGAFLYDMMGITLAFKWTGAALAAAIMAFPLMVRPIRLSFEAIDRGLLPAAETLGASAFTVFRTVTLPLAMPGILAAAILGFAKAMGEFGATVTFVSNIPGETRTMALAIHTFTQTIGGEGAALFLIGVSLAISVVAIGFSELIAERLTRRVGVDPKSG
ncbi:MAG: molybdate ABC transporter permease subunit [Pseudomonadota bacterium]